MSVNRKVLVPVGGLATTLMSSLLPSRGHYSSATFLGFSVHPGAWKRLAAFAEHASGAYLPVWEGDRRDSNPRPSEPQSVDIGCLVLH
jgi:hypothetical protein